MTYVTVGHKQKHSALMELTVQYWIQYLKSLPLAGYELDGMTEDTKGTLTYDQEIGVQFSVGANAQKPWVPRFCTKIVKKELKKKFQQE